ncbi:MAG: ATP-binding protein, partial [Gammaproteobacteria bacterium]
MKILNIYFKNINSLEGVNRVNFEQSPFSDTGVFAITGPNGSGKSSILDAITLGLYGETFRFDRPALHVMTKHTAECFSEIEFALGNEKYRSSWHVRREAGDPDGELLPAEMKLWHLSGTEEVLAETPQEVCTRITDITGMNFRNFTRSILLAQGDFAAFLNALDSERMDILEKIISSDIYADYKKELTDKVQAAQSRLENLEQDLSLLGILEPEKREAREHDLADFTEQYQDLQAELTALQQQQYSMQKIEALRNQVAVLENEIRQAEDEAAKNRENLSKIASFPDALSYRDELTLINEKKQAIEEAKAALSSYQNELKQLETVFVDAGIDRKAPEGIAGKSVFDQQESIFDVRAEMSRLDAFRYSESMKLQSLTGQINEKKAALDSVTTWMENHGTEASLVEDFPDIVKLKNLRTEKTEITEKLKSIAQLSKTTNSALKDQKTAIEKENSRLERLESELETEQKYLEELSRGKSLDEIEELRVEQQERVDTFKELLKLAAAYRKLKGNNGGFLGLFKSKEMPFRTPNELEDELENLRQEIKREGNIEFILDASVAREALMKRMAQDRHQLIEGKPCPLCGSLDNPYAKKTPIVPNSQQALADQQQKLKTLRIQVEKLEQEIAASKKRSEKNRSTDSELQLISSQWSTLANRLNIKSSDLSIVNLKLMERLREKEDAELKDIAFLSAKFRNKQNAIEKLKVSIVKSAERIDQLQAKYQQLEAEWQERPDELADIESRLAQCQQEESDLTAKIEAQLAAVGEKMPAKGKEDLLFDRLNQRRQEYQTYMIRRDTLTEELKTLADQQAAADSDIDDCNEKIRRLDARLKNEEIVGLHLALIEKQKMIADQQQLIAQLKVEAADLQSSLLEKVEDTPFYTLSLLTEIVELTQDQAQLEQRLGYLEQ